MSKTFSSSSSKIFKHQIDPEPVLSNLSELFLNEQFSDACFVADRQRLPVHKVILAARSEYFRALLYNGMKESKQTDIEIKVSSVSAFKLIVSYLYCNPIELDQLELCTTLELLGLAHEYGLNQLVSSIVEYLNIIVTIENVAIIYDSSELHNLRQLSDKCLKLIDNNALVFIESNSFNSLSVSSVKSIIERDEFFALEIDILRAIDKWIVWNGIDSQEIVKEIYSLIRWPLISSLDLVSVGHQTGLITVPDICYTIVLNESSEKSELKNRINPLLNKNLITEELNGKITIDHDNKNLLETFYGWIEEGDTASYCRITCTIYITPLLPVYVTLGKKYIANLIQLKISTDSDQIFEQNIYSYSIDISDDRNDWIQLKDNSKLIYEFNSDISFLFRSRTIKYIRLIFWPLSGVPITSSNNSQSIFKLDYFNCMFTDG